MEWIRRIVKTPIEPEDKDVFWLDISVPNYAVLKYYENGEWKIVRHSEDGTAYILPVGGIPYSDLSQDVKNRIDLAKEQSDWNQNNASAVDYIKNKPNVAAKADKVEGATAGNLASLDAEGNITDSGISKDFIEDNYQHLYHCTLQEVLNPKDGDICIVPVSYNNIPITGIDDSNIFNFTSVNRKVKWRVTNGAEEWFFFRWTSDSEEVITTPSLPENVTGFPIEGIVDITNSTGEAALIWDTEFRSSVQYLTLYDVVPETAYLYIAQDWVKLEDLNKKGPDNVQQIYNSPLSEVTNPKEGDICVVPGHEDSISISLEPGASLISFNVPYKTLRWAVDESVQTVAIAEIRYRGSLTNYYLYQPIPTGEEDVPTVFGGTIEADRSEFALVWDDDEVFAENLQYISLYSVIPDLAYVYRSGSWERIEDMSDVLRYSFQNLTSTQQKQARENILAFPGPFENKTEVTSNDSLAKYIRNNYRTPGIYSFTFNGKLSDGDIETGTYKVIVITSSTFTGIQYAGVSNYASFVLIEPNDYDSPFENRLYRVVERYASGSYQPTYVLEGYYIKPQGGIPASDIANGVIPDVSLFITKTVNDLTNYYLKSETYTKAEIQSLISAIRQFTYEVVSTLPTATADTIGKIYLVPSADPQTQNVKDEYITIDNGASAETRYTWEQIGSTAIDLSGYVTTSDLTTALADYTTTVDLTTLLNGKVDKVRGATSGNFAGLDGNGNLTDSGKKASDFLTSHQPVTDNNPTLAWNTKSKVATIGSTDIHVVMPDNPNTDTQADWNESDSNDPAYIKNKPTIPSVPVTDVTVGGTSVVSNGTAAVPAIPTVPAISTDIASDAMSDSKTTSPKAVKTFVEGKGYGTYSKPSGGIPASDIESGVIPTVPTISTNIAADATSDSKTASPKAVKTYVDAQAVTIDSSLSTVSENPVQNKAVKNALDAKLGYTFAGEITPEVVSAQYLTYGTVQEVGLFFVDESLNIGMSLTSEGIKGLGLVSVKNV